ncbi:hypothetical protein [Pseudoroseicyclus aestuarii]|uniref:Uncharacterized protein n=1 Tax=Pseudoroseicyclus aestuarii TaxID=1795041 RepID=A0A318SYM5_9RHOB|nr:hypothetical protein [Pseudoroseicyclus aestuarii]PYE80827.1 hypothetical protein DFP88_11137 [Pseudoroseicyclus aestuarii]
MKDRLSEIIGDGRAAFALLRKEDQQALIDEKGSRRRAERSAWGRLTDEQRRGLILQAGHVPELCGDAAPVAPARGPVRVFETQAFYPKGEDEYELKPAGYKGRKTMQLADAIDIMAHEAARKRGKLVLTAEQVAIGREYAGLYERYHAGGVRCASLEVSGARSAGGRGGDVTEARLAERDRLLALQRRIGDGVAMPIRRVRPSKRGADRRAISDRQLVDGVFIEGLTVTELLNKHGWAKSSTVTKAAFAGLAAALERMLGQRALRPGRTTYFGVRPQSPFERA